LNRPKMPREVGKKKKFERWSEKRRGRRQKESIYRGAQQWGAHFADRRGDLIYNWLKTTPSGGGEARGICGLRRVSHPQCSTSKARRSKKDSALLEKKKPTSVTGT